MSETIRDIVDEFWPYSDGNEWLMEELIEKLEEREAWMLWPASGEREAT